MRRIVVAGMLSTFALAAAAATPPAQNNGAVSTIATLSPVSTGVTSPRLYSTAVVSIPADPSLNQFPNPAEMLLRVHLDAAGNTTKVQVLRSISPVLNAYVVDAVRRFRWRPAELDNRNIPYALNLVVRVQH